MLTKFFLVFVCLSVLLPTRISASSQTIKGEVITTQADNVLVQLEDGEQSQALSNFPAGIKPKPGDQVLLEPNLIPEDNLPPYIVVDYQRTRPLLLLTLIFVITTLLVTRLWGLKSFVSLLFSFFLIFNLLLPQIMAGEDPVAVTILTSLYIIPATFYLSHGINRKTHAAILGTAISLLITGVLATFFVNLTHLTGLASEEAGFLLSLMGEKVSTRGLLLSGIILGTLGVLDDVTVSQSAIVSELKTANLKLTDRELFTRAMRVGHDHISSMINTLILVYTGASLPLLLLFLDSSQTFAGVVNHEIIAEEIVRTLVGSLGLILAVPITTLIAVRFAKR